MQRGSQGFVDLVPTRGGWTMSVGGGDARRCGTVRLPEALTWMQQRRAIEERLRSWGHRVPPDAAWTRAGDGSLRLPLVPAEEDRAA